MEQQLLTIDELASYLKVKKSWIYSRTREKGPEAMPHQKWGKYLRFSLRNVLAWLEDQQEG